MVLIMLWMIFFRSAPVDSIQFSVNTVWRLFQSFHVLWIDQLSPIEDWKWNTNVSMFLVNILPLFSRTPSIFLCTKAEKICFGLISTTSLIHVWALFKWLLLHICTSADIDVVRHRFFPCFNQISTSSDYIYNWDGCLLSNTLIVISIIQRDYKHIYSIHALSSVLINWKFFNENSESIQF